MFIKKDEIKLGDTLYLTEGTYQTSICGTVKEIHIEEKDIYDSETGDFKYKRKIFQGITLTIDNSIHVFIRDNSRLLPSHVKLTNWEKR